MSTKSPNTKSPGRGAASQAPADAPLKLRVNVSEIPEGGRHVEIVADAEARERLAQAAGVLAVESLVARFDVTRERDGMRATGDVQAKVKQTCVVTLDTIENTIREDVDTTFLPPDEIAVAMAKLAAAEDAPESMMPAADPPEPLEHGGADLGALATEYFLLGIDPYPRKPDAAFEAENAAPDPADHPFAALAALKRDPGAADR